MLCNWYVNIYWTMRYWDLLVLQPERPVSSVYCNRIIPGVFILAFPCHHGAIGPCRRTRGVGLASFASRSPNLLTSQPRSWGHTGSKMGHRELRPWMCGAWLISRLAGHPTANHGRLRRCSALPIFSRCYACAHFAPCHSLSSCGWCTSTLGHPRRVNPHQ